MAGIIVDLAIDTPHGSRGQAGRLLVTASRAREAGSTVAYPQAFSFALPASGARVCEIPVPAADWYWHLLLYAGNTLVRERTVQWEASAPVAWSALLDVDPLSFTPIETAPPSVAESLAAIRKTVQDHEESLTPHPAYDDMQSLTLIYQNGLV